MAAFGMITPGSGANNPGSSFVPTLQASLKAPASTSVNGGGLIPQQLPFKVPNGSLPNPGMPNLFPSTPTGPQPPDIFGNTPDPTTGALHGRGASTAGGVPQVTAKPVAAPTVPGLTPPPTPMQYTSSLPQVQSAWNNYQTGYNTYATNLRSQMEAAAIAYGTPVPGSDTGGRTVAQMLRYNVDPATQALAAAATKSGVSTLAQLALARTNALRNAAFAGNAGGVSGSSAQYVDTENATRQANLAAFNAAQALQGQGQGFGQTFIQGVEPLWNAYQDSIGNGLQYVNTHPGAYPTTAAPSASTARLIAQGMAPGLAKVAGGQSVQAMSPAVAPPSSTVAQLIGQGMTPALARQYAGVPWRYG